MVIPSLDKLVASYTSAGIAASTRKAYNSAHKRFHSFCIHFSIGNPFPVSESLLCYFAAFLAREGLAPTSIKVYLAAVRYMQVVMGFPEPRAVSCLPRLKLVINGIARTRASTDQTHGRPRLPITTDVLGKLFDVLSARPQSHSNILLWAACSVCFFGFFRAGEITVPSRVSFTSNRHLSWGDVCVDSITQPGMVKVHLKFSKCDQLGKGVDVFCGRTGNRLCPVAACLAYIAIRGAAPGPFFCWENGSPLTKPQFISLVREALTEAGMNASLYSGHSFRVGAATSAAQAGMEDSVIKSLGRWSSTAFLLYIRTPRQQLAQLTTSLAHTPH